MINRIGVNIRLILKNLSMIELDWFVYIGKIFPLVVIIENIEFIE